jgi:hypothetical protein
MTSFERRWWTGLCRTQRQADAWAVYLSLLTGCAVLLIAAATATLVHFFFTE